MRRLILGRWAFIMSIYLARFFLNSKTGGQQRHLLLEDNNLVMAEHLAEGCERGEDPRFFEGQFENLEEAVHAFERLAMDASNDDYVLTDIMDRFAQVIPVDAKPKPAWQQAIDRFYLATLMEDFDIELPDEPTARAEPMWLHLEALRAWRFETDRAREALEPALAARAELRQRSAEKKGYYSWSLPEGEQHAALEEHLFGMYRQLGDIGNAFRAIRTAQDIAPNMFRNERLATLQCFHFPQYRNDAFAQAFRYSNCGFDDVLAHPDYAAFAKRRQAEIASEAPIVRWRSMCVPNTQGEIEACERQIAAKLPEDFRDFLLSRGKSRLDFLRGRRSATLTFAAAEDLLAWRDAFQSWLNTMGDADEGYSLAWAKELGVDRQMIWSIATPWDHSRCLVISLAGDETHGRCFLWDHDDAYLLEPIGATFTDALAAIEEGFVSGDARISTLLS